MPSFGSSTGTHRGEGYHETPRVAGTQPRIHWGSRAVENTSGLLFPSSQEPWALLAPSLSLHTELSPADVRARSPSW